MVKNGYNAEMPKVGDMTYWENLIAEIKDTWWETKDLILAVWNTVLQIIELVTAIVPVVRTLFKKWIDALRYYW